MNPSIGTLAIVAVRMHLHGKTERTPAQASEDVIINDFWEAVTNNKV